MNPTRQGRRIDAVLFDFDGTLFDTTVAICGAFNETLVERGHARVPEEQISAMIGRPLREMFVELSPAAARTDEDIEACFTAYRKHFLPLSVSCSSLMPTARETVETLVERGIALAVVTTRTADGARHILRGHGLDQAFSQVIGLEHVEQTKPHPEPVLAALERLEVSARQAVMVGDTPDDVAAGRGAGTITVGVATGPYDASALRDADLVVPVLSDFLPYIGPGRVMLG